MLKGPRQMGIILTATAVMLLCGSSAIEHTPNASFIEQWVAMISKYIAMLFSLIAIAIQLVNE